MNYFLWVRRLKIKVGAIVQHIGYFPNDSNKKKSWRTSALEGMLKEGKSIIIML